MGVGVWVGVCVRESACVCVCEGECGVACVVCVCVCGEGGVCVCVCWTLLRGCYRKCSGCCLCQEWIQQNNILSIVLRDSLHQPQYVEKLEKILRFVIKEKL